MYFLINWALGIACLAFHKFGCVKTAYFVFVGTCFFAVTSPCFPLAVCSYIMMAAPLMPDAFTSVVSQWACGQGAVNCI